jgi:hypothetical protein
MRAFLATACSDATTGPTSVATPLSATALHSGSGSSGSGGSVSGGGGGGGGSTASIPQVGGSWRGQEHYDPSLSIYFFTPEAMNPPIAMTLVEDAAGNITGTDNGMSIVMTGKASSNGTIVLQDGVYYGQKITVSITGSVTCSDGSTGTVLSGKFQHKEGFGTISVDNCPIA